MSFSPRLIVLYVRDVAVSRAFYEPIFGAPLEATENFVMFGSGADLRLAIWAVGQVEPAATFAPGGCEICAPMAEADVVRLHDEWLARGARIAQGPTRLDFGLSVLALDPDGHRLRLFHPVD